MKKSIPCYIIYSNEKLLSRLLAENNLADASLIKQSVCSDFPKELIFNVEKARNLLNRDIALNEIERTLSHIKCWKSITEDTSIEDHQFVLIIEDNIELVENARELAFQYANKYSSYDIIKLQHDGEHRSGERLFQETDEPDALIYGDINQYNHGCGLYLIRKDLAKKLTALLSEKKPYWLADQFTEFHDPQNIAQARYLLGEELYEKKQEKIENPLFSVIVPIYNVERYLEQCIESVLAQDFHNYELILVDDGSPDNSIDICVKYAKQYKNIVFIHKTNGGLSDARNAGIQIARGQYLIFLDSDDYWEGNHVLSDLTEITKSSPDVILHDCTFLEHDNEKTYPIDFSNLTGDYLDDFNHLVLKHIYRPSAWTKIIKSSILTENKIFFPLGKNHEDLDWSFELANYIKSYALYHSYFYIYRCSRLGSITHQVKKGNVLDVINIITEKIEKLRSLEKNNLYYGLRDYLYTSHLDMLSNYNLLAEHDKEDIKNVYSDYIKIANIAFGL